MLNSARHSYVDLDDSRHLEFAVRQVDRRLRRHAGARPGSRCGRCTSAAAASPCPATSTSTRPGSFNRVLELDGELVELDRARLGVTPGPLLEIEVGDARTAVARQPTGDFDLVIGDAFGHLVVPWHLTTREFVADIRRALRPGGSYALNVIDYPPPQLRPGGDRHHPGRLRRRRRWSRRPGPWPAISGANFVILASDAPLPLADLRERMAALPSPTSVLSGAELDAFVGDARVLIDDFAPVDQLLTHP